MTWFTFPGWGDYNLNGLAEKELVVTGAHGYATQAESKAKPNASPSPDQQFLLQAFNAASLSPVGAAGGSGVLSSPHGTGGISGAASNIAGSAGSSVSSAIKFIGQGGIWARATEVIAGLVLLYAGVKALTAPAGANVGRMTAKHTAHNVKRVAKAVAK